MKFRYHGQFCGPGWSDGQYKADAAGFSTPISYFDACCKDHDRELAEGTKTRYQADVDFAKCALSAGRVDEAVAVYYYGLLARETKMTKNKSKKQQPKSKALAVIPRPPRLRSGANDSMLAAPVSIATRRTGMSASVTNLSDGIVRIKHRAFIKPITSFSSFTAEKLSCNPGLSGSFPWLSKLARKYDMYRFVNLKYSYRSVTATSTPGVVMLSFDYDAADGAPTTKSKQAQTIPNAESNSWTNVDLVVKTDSAWRFSRPGILAANLDVKTYDMGSLFYSSVYGTGVVTGELYVEYTVELKRPSDGVLDSGSQRFNTTNFAQPLGSPATPSGFLPYEVLTVNQLGFITSGEWTFMITATGTTMTTAPSVPTISTSGSGVVSNIFSIVSATATVTFCRVRAENGDVLSISSAGAGATVNAVFLRISVADFDTML